jgi:aryl-alcohol dehydrogenase-like predicted oxidoreductase
LGQGTWHFTEYPSRPRDEIAALRLGFDLGLTAIDTAEMYADGDVEILVGEGSAGRRDEVFLVSKMLPENARPPRCRRADYRGRLTTVNARGSVPRH